VKPGGDRTQDGDGSGYRSSSFTKHIPIVIEPPPGHPPAVTAILVGYGGDSPDMYYNTVM